MNKIYTDTHEIKNKVLEDYRKESVELSSLFFDFEVKLPEKQLLEIYADIQHIINGDTVMRLENVQIEETDDPNDNIWGTKAENFIPVGMYENIYKGNYKDFLESFNGKEEETGLCRVMDVEENGRLVGGDRLDFVW